MMEGQVWVHPDSVAADRKHTMKVLAIDPSPAKCCGRGLPTKAPSMTRVTAAAVLPARPPSTDGHMVYAYFGPEGLYAYDFSGPPELESRRAFHDTGTGTGTHRCSFEELVIIQRDEDEGKESVIAAYDKQIGQEVWKTKRPVRISWSTPVLVAAANRRTELVTNGTELAIRLRCRPRARSCGGRRA